MRITTLFLLMVAVFVGTAFGERLVSFRGSDASPALETRLEESDQVHVTINLTAGGLLLDEVNAGGKTFSRLYWENSGVEGDLGQAELPVFRFFIEIPSKARVNASINYINRKDLVLADLGIENQVIPVQLPREKLPGAMKPFEFDSDYYSGSVKHDRPVIEIEGYHLLRGHSLASVIVRPIDYSPEDGTIRVIEEINFRLDFNGSDLIETYSMLERYRSRHFNQLTDEIALNQGVFENDELDELPASLGYLIISVNNADYLTALEPFVEWKRDMGYHVTLVTTAITGTGNTDIHDYIQDAYDTWDIPPSFVLFIGDSPGIPHFIGDGIGSPPTDLNYAMLAGNDYFPDIGVGRFSVANLTDLQNILDKTLQYEQATWDVGDDWIMETVFMASTDNFQVSEGTHNYVINNYLDPAGFSYDRLYTVTYNATTADVTNSFNDGRNYGTYSGHGSTTSWADGPPFSQANVNALVNEVFPFIQSYACITGNFTYTECFGETWIRTDNGALAFWGSTVNSYWDEDDILEKRVFEGFFDNQNPDDPYNFTWINGMTDYGKMRLYDFYGNTGYVRRYFEMYNVLGDGSVDLWTGTPVEVVVTHPGVLLLGMQEMDVSVNGAPEWTVVCARSQDDETVFASGYTDDNGDVTLVFDDPLSEPCTLTLTVTGHDVLPYTTPIQVVPAAGGYPLIQDISVDDIGTGNGNGLADYGEQFDLLVEIENVGTETLELLEVVISTTSQWLSVDGTTVIIDELVPEAATTINIPSEVSLDAADAASAPLTISMTDGFDNWEQDAFLTLHAPQLSLTILMVDDETGGNGNHRLDAGETASIGLRIENIGSASLTGSSFGAFISDPNLENLIVNAGLVNLPAGGSVELTDALELDVSAVAPDMERAWLGCELIRLDGYRWSAFDCLDIGGLFNDLEGPDQGWSHYGNPGWGDQWHISSEQNWTPGGGFSWKAGDTGVGDYDNDLDACLELPALEVPGPVVLSFYHWMESETSDWWEGECYDGGRVEISTDGQNWAALPMPGYNYITRGQGPFGTGELVYSGSIDWTREQALINADPGMLYVRFRFGSDLSITEEGWYLDDISIVLPDNLTPPNSLEAELAGSNAVLQWDTPGGELDELQLLGFIVYREGQPVTDVLQQTDYEDPLDELPHGPYSYTVSAVYEEGESVAAGPVVVIWGPQTLIITATPQNPPVIIQAWGGSFQWDAVIENVSGGPYTFDAWTEVILPNGNTYGPLAVYENLTLENGQVLSASPTQFVPSYAPGGWYIYIAKVGDYPNDPVDSDGFEFGKNPLDGPATDSMDGIEGWNVYGWFDEIEDVTSAVVPTEFAIDQVYPNPFNPTTNVSIALPLSSELQVVVFNVIGQQVDVLANGRYAEGYHNLTFDASSLSSGIYFIQATVPGKMNELRKVVLMK